MGSRLILSTIVICVVSGCQSHHFVARNAVKQINTINDVLQQEVIDNIAVFASNHDALPFFAVVGDGLAQVTDSGSLTPLLTFNKAGFSGTNITMNASRGLQENWKLSPCMTAGRLARLRCAFQFIFAHPVLQVVDQVDGTAWVRVDQGCFKCVEEMVRVGILPTPVDTGKSPLEAIQPAQQGGWVFKAGSDPIRRHEAAVAYANQLQQGLDCSFPTGWFGVGRKCNVPKCACYTGSTCDTYVWVEPAGMDAFSRFTITVLALATIDPPVPLPNYLPSGPPPKPSNAQLRNVFLTFFEDAKAFEQTTTGEKLTAAANLPIATLDAAVKSEELTTTQLIAIRHLAEVARTATAQAQTPTDRSVKLRESASRLIDLIDEYLAPPQSTLLVPVWPQGIPDAFSRAGSMPFSRGGGLEFFPQIPTQ